MPEVTEKRLFDFIGLSYEAAQSSEADQWLDVYRTMADMFDAGPGGFAAFDTHDQLFRIIATTCEPILLNEYNAHFQFVNPLHPRLTGLEPYERLNRAEIINDTRFRKHEIYQDFYRRVDHFHFEYRVMLQYESSYAGVIFTRPDGHPNFSERETVQMNYLMPHLARAFKLYFNLQRAHADNEVLVDIMDRIPQGVIVIDGKRTIIHANSRGHSLLKGSNGLSIVKGRLQTARSNRALERLIHGIFDKNAFAPDNYGGVALVERDEYSRPLEVLVSPFRAGERYGLGSTLLAILFVTDPADRGTDISDILSDLYGLTRAEAKVTSLLVVGDSLAEVCDEMGIALNTGRTHLKRVFSKTGTNSQSALMKLALAGIANVARRKEGRHVTHMGDDI